MAETIYGKQRISSLYMDLLLMDWPLKFYLLLFPATSFSTLSPSMQYLKVCCSRKKRLILCNSTEWISPRKTSRVYWYRIWSITIRYQIQRIIHKSVTLRSSYVNILHHKINVTGHLLLPFVPNWNRICKILLSQPGKILGVIEVHPQFQILHCINGYY